ncbi:hypothetical protein GbCGDNIH3_8111 [Granulibacter bethesdensis]|uniref:Uncharacterized protein n=1 Tax=Granulibacter bethesdensis TaxID=364410 RepID=A0AAN1ANW2_9PROT|nr:hypothetical protein GbCGDNIH3_8111 [Granulibacter bethesdensis]
MKDASTPAIAAHFSPDAIISSNPPVIPPYGLSHVDGTGEGRPPS